MSSATAALRAAVPVSSARAEASRKNGAKSRGPKTPEGKAPSAQNALKHGMHAQKHLVLPDEDAAAHRSRRSDALPASTANGCSSGGASRKSRARSLGALLAPDCELVKLNARPRGSRRSARENLPLEGKLGPQPASDPGGAI
jgi:hypothetical protein